MNVTLQFPKGKQHFVTSCLPPRRRSISETGCSHLEKDLHMLKRSKLLPVRIDFHLECGGGGSGVAGGGGGGAK